MPSARFAAQAIHENISTIAAEEDSDDDDVTLLNMPTTISLDDNDNEDEDEVLELTSQRKRRHSADHDYEEGGEGENNEDGQEDDEDEGPPSTKRRQIDGDNEEGTADADEDGEDDDIGADPAPAKKRVDPARPPVLPASPLATCDIEFTALIFTAEAMKKPKSSHKPIPKVFTLESDAPWTTMKTRLRPLIRAVFKPATLKFEEYNITFVVPRKVTTAMPLVSSDNFKHLLKHAVKIKNDPTAKITIEPIPDTSTKENEEASPKAKKGKGTKICNMQDILLANGALNAKISTLRERWLCPTPNGHCGSAHCFVHPNEIDHFPLSHAHFDSWAAAMLKGDSFVTIDKPPNNELFDKVNLQTLAARSPLLQRRLELAQKQPTNTVLQININIPPELLAFLCPAPALITPPAIAANGPKMLIPHGALPGPKLLIEEFCEHHALDDEICARFR
ncbi:hypothetical protein DFH08DRAFT_1080098 [Mycena albidolilacea]|uniref:Uncharacterized protein n=1 Tax=Mycena albidolilacea TaxID=1033008 RepID=A0AAD7ERE0_9AGAR|nr:hypothetical protein DFH08DRAFT_1080098 [Mycena albidolilacea]